MQLSITTLLLLASAAQAADMAKCYRMSGEEDPEMLPCDPTAKVSYCCRKNDFCLSNGLCMGGGDGGNNGFAQQGCTAQKWDELPCQKLCTDVGGRYVDGLHYIQLCSGFDASAENLLCCGGDYTCCKNTDRFIKSVPKFSSVFRAGMTEPTGSDKPATVTITATATPTAGGGGGGGDASSSSSGDSNNSKVVAVGAGVGASLGVALIGVVSLLLWQMRKQKRYRAVAETPGTPAPEHVYSGVPKPQPETQPQQYPTELPANQ